MESGVGAGRVRLDNSETDRFAASWAGLTDLKLHGMSLRLTSFEANRGRLKMGPNESMRGPGDGISVDRIVLLQRTGLSSVNVAPVTLGFTVA